MGKLVIESKIQTSSINNSFDIDSFLESRSSFNSKNMQEIKDAEFLFRSLVEGKKQNESITYAGNIYTIEEFYNVLISKSMDDRKEKINRIVDEFIKNSLMFDGTLINNGTVIDIADDMKERAFNSYDYETKTVEYVMGRRLTLDELYQKYRTVNTEEQNEFTNAELCEDLASKIDVEILESTLDGMEMTVHEYFVDVIPTLMNKGTNVEVNGSLIPVNVLFKEIADHQREYLDKKKEEETKRLEEELNRTNENPNLVGEINVALRNNSSLEVTTEMPLLEVRMLTDEEILSLKSSALISPGFVENYYYDQISRLKSSIYNTTNEQNLVFNEKMFNEIVSLVSEHNSELDILIDTTKELITNKRNSFIKVNINSEDLIDITHGLINELSTELSAITSSDQFNELFGKVYSLYIDLLGKGIRDLQLDAKILLVLNEVSKKRTVFDSTLTNISPEIQKIKFDLDEQMKKIRQEILAIECNRTELNQLSGKIIMITHLVEKARNDVLNASHNHKFSDYNNKFTNDSLNYYLSQLEMYEVALDNMNKIGYGKA